MAKTKAKTQTKTKATAKAKPKSAKVARHTLDNDAQLDCADATVEDLAAIGLAVTGAPDKVRIVAGGRRKGDSDYEAVAFGEANVGRTWSVATKVLSGDKAYQAIAAKLRRVSDRYKSFVFGFEETLDGFSEQQDYADELDD